MNLPTDASWLSPPKTVADIISAPKEPSVILSPNGKHMLLIESAAMPEIADLARPMLRLAGIRIDPQSRTKFRNRFGSAITCRPVEPVRVHPADRFVQRNLSRSNMRISIFQNQKFQIGRLGQSTGRTTATTSLLRFCMRRARRYLWHR